MSRQLQTRPLPVTPVPIGYCARKRRFADVSFRIEQSSTRLHVAPTHKHPNVKKWLAKHPRFHLHFTPTSASWLNLVERWFGEITRKRIRQGVFKSVPELVTAIDEFIRLNNKNPKPFVWTKTVNDILKKIKHCKAVIETLH